MSTTNQTTNVATNVAQQVLGKSKNHFFLGAYCEPQVEFSRQTPLPSYRVPRDYIPFPEAMEDELLEAYRAYDEDEMTRIIYAGIDAFRDAPDTISWIFLSTPGGDLNRLEVDGARRLVRGDPDDPRPYLNQYLKKEHP